MWRSTLLLAALAAILSATGLVLVLALAGDDAVPDSGPPPAGAGRPDGEPDDDQGHQVGDAIPGRLQVTVEVVVRTRIDAARADSADPDERFRGLPGSVLAFDGDRTLVQVARADGSSVLLAVGPDGGVAYTEFERLAGQVFGSDGTPLDGAEIWAGETAADGVRQTVRTGVEGRFEIDLPSDRGVAIVASHPGHATQWRVVDRPRGRAHPPLVLRLPAAAALRITLAAAVPAPERARILILPVGADVDSEVLGYPFALTSRSARLGEPILGLPRGARVTVEVVHPRCAGVAPVSVELRHAEQTVVVPTAFAGVVRGHVLDGGGRPVVGARVESGSGRDPASRRRVSGVAWPVAAAAPAGVAATVTDPEGRFEVGRDHGGPDGGCVVRIAADGYFGCSLVVARDAPAVVERTVTLSPSAAPVGDPTLRLRLPNAEQLFVRRRGESFREWPADEPWTLRLDAPGVVDVIIGVGGPDGRAERRYDGVAVLGPTDLDVSR